MLLLVSAVRSDAADRHFIVLDPGHSHALGVLEQEPAKIEERVDVYAPPGPDVQQFLKGVDALNHRPTKPTHWRVESYVGPDFKAKMLHEPPGNIVVITGRNNGKLESILASVKAGQNVIADKPWIVEHGQLPQLEEAVKIAAEHHVIAYDCMTERFNVAYRIQRELMRDPEIFGRAAPGSEAEPSVVLQNIHSVVKYSSGKVNLRPSWFFDIRQQGQAIADVGTHLVDLAMWTLFPEQAIDYRTEVKVSHATRSPIYLTLPEFQRVTGEQTWPTFLQGAVKGERLRYDCNNSAVFSIRGIYAGISDRWEYESVGALSDTYLVQYRGTRSTIRVRQSKLEHYIPELDVIPNNPSEQGALEQALRDRLTAMASMFPNLSIRADGNGIRVVIPSELRSGSTFRQLVNKFLGYVDDPNSFPTWESRNLISKYYITTTAAAMAVSEK